MCSSRMPSSGGGAGNLGPLGSEIRARRLPRHPHWPGERTHLSHSDIDLETHITDVVLTRFEDLRDIVLLGHSYAGLVITGAADCIPDHISRLVYLDTAPLPDGVALIGTFPVEARQRICRLCEERTRDPI